MINDCDHFCGGRVPLFLVGVVGYITPHKCAAAAAAISTISPYFGRLCTYQPTKPSAASWRSMKKTKKKIEKKNIKILKKNKKRRREVGCLHHPSSFSLFSCRNAATPSRLFNVGKLWWIRPQSGRHAIRIESHILQGPSRLMACIWVYIKKRVSRVFLSLFFRVSVFFSSSLLCIIQHLTSVSLSGSLPFFRLFLLFPSFSSSFAPHFLLPAVSSSPPPFPSLLMSSKAIRTYR